MMLPRPASLQLAREALDRHVGEDQRLQAPELDRARTDITRALRAQGLPDDEASRVAGDVLLEALGLRGDGTTAHRLDEDDHVQLAYRFGSQLAHHERNLADLLRNQHMNETTAARDVPVRVAIADANANGRLDAGDVVAVSSPGGRELMSLDATLANHLAIARGMQLAVDRMVNDEGRSRFRFELFPPVVNPKYFALGANDTGILSHFRLREGASASAALDDLVANAEQYGFECNSAIQVAWHLAQLHIYRERYGAEAAARFDADFAKMAIGPDAKTVVDVRHIEVERAGGSRLIGDHEYIQNSAVDAHGYVTGWQGENVVYMGRDEHGEPRYYGHPFGLTNEHAIIAHLQAQAQRIDYASADHSVQVLDRETRARLAELAKRPEGDQTDPLLGVLLERLGLVADLRTSVRELARAGDPATEAARAVDTALSELARGASSVSNADLQDLMVRAEELDRAFDAAGDRVLEVVNKLLANIALERKIEPDAAIASLEALRKIPAQAPATSPIGTRMYLPITPTRDAG